MSLEGCRARGEAVYAGPLLRFLDAQEINKDKKKKKASNLYV
jgi:hypothetical protein